MTQVAVTSINITKKVKMVLEQRKRILSSRIGRSISFDEVLRYILQVT